MKTVALVSALMAICLTAQAGDYEITVDRKREMGTSGGNNAQVKTSQNWTGEVNIEYHAFNPSPALEARYVIFVKRQKLGQAANAEDIDKVKGSFSVPSIKPGAKATFNTVDVPLFKAHMAPHWKMVEGRQSAEDTLAGVWLRLYNGSTQVAEYINPTTLTMKYKWEQ